MNSFCVVVATAFVLLAQLSQANYIFVGPLDTTSYGATAQMRYQGTDPTAFANLTLEAIFVAQTQLRIRIYPTSNANANGTPLPQPYVVPDLVFPGSENAANTYTAAASPRYDFSIVDNLTVVVRDTHAAGKIVYAFYNFTFETQIVSFTTSGEQQTPFLFGYGEHDYHYFINRDANVTLSLWNTDNGTPWKKPMYGVHPVVFTAAPVTVPVPMFSGLLFLNSHAQNVQIVNHAEQTFLALGGIMDLFVFLGNNSFDVTSQYHRAIGPAAVPPYWALGIHQCRWGYHNLSEVEAVVAGYQHAALPLDVMWNDIDYMDNFRVFTTDPVRYPQAQLEAFVDNLHSQGMRYMQITDPGVATAMDYETYTSGIAEQVFVTENDGVTPLVNVVWPGWTVFPDFSLPKAIEWWAGQIEAYRKNVTIDGMWLDMNELGTFCAGQCRVAPGTPWSADWKTINWNTFTDDICVPNNCTVVDSPFNYPPINPLENGYNLYNKTLDMTGKLAIGPYYSTKAFYGFLEVKASYEALLNQTGERPFLLTRASFVGSGRYTAHWTGDNDATWTPRQGGIGDSIQGVLGSNLWGIFTVGADIGGFGGISNEELVVRWYQLGVFYTFTRNHHDLNGPGQEPYKFSSPAQDAIRTALHMRYRYLPYLFTNLLQSSMHGGPVLRHLSMEFPMDFQCYAESTNFMFGASILVAPVVAQGATAVDVYLPAETMWYNATSLEVVSFAGGVNVSAPVHAAVGVSYSDIPIFIRGGSIIPIHDLLMRNLNLTQKKGVGLLFFMQNSSEIPSDFNASKSVMYTASGEAWSAGDKVVDFTHASQFEIVATGTRTQGTITASYFKENVPSYNFYLPRRVQFTVIFPTCEPELATNTTTLQLVVDGLIVELPEATFTCNSLTFLMPLYQDGLTSYELQYAIDGTVPTPAPTSPSGGGKSGLSGRDKHIIIGATIGGVTVLIIGVAIVRWMRRGKPVDELVPLQEGEGV